MKNMKGMKKRINNDHRLKNIFSPRRVQRKTKRNVCYKPENQFFIKIDSFVLFVVSLFLVLF